jgi:hypothetical protein
MSMIPHTRGLTTLVIAAALAAGCQAPSSHPMAAAAQAAPAALVAPQGLDWASPQVVSRAAAKARDAHVQRRLLAFPATGAAWAGGLDLTAYGCAPGDTVPNGPAVAFPVMTPELTNQLFFVSGAGKLLRINRADPTASLTLDLGKACSRTAVALSPTCTRAYVLSDDGTLFVVDTIAMAVLTTVRVNGGYGVSPCLDRLASFNDDTRDVLYVSANDGQVHQLVIEPTAEGGAAVTARADFPVATDAQPLAGTRKVAAPAVAVGGVIYLGDQAGRFHAYDTANAANRAVYQLGAPINTPPALELQDSSYAMRDPYGNPKAVGYGEAVYAFVNAGAACAWINLHDTSVTFSQPLRIDDNEATRTYGYLKDYAFSTAGTTETLVAVDGGNLNTESPDRPLPGYGAIRSNDVLAPAETNTYELAGEAAGGEVKSFLRWASARAHPLGSVIASATLTLSAAADQACRVPQIKATSPFMRAGDAVWSSDALTNANRPALGPAVGRYLGGVLASGNVVFKRDKPHQWDVTAAFSQPSGAYALALEHDAGGDAVLWPAGPVGGATGKKAKKAYQVEAVTFRNNALNADPAPAKANDDRPLLTLTVSGTVLPTPTIETPPVIDPYRQHVYVFYTNALYEIDFSAPERWSDTDPSGARHTAFALAHHGRSANGGGATFNGKKGFVGNFTAPLVNHDGSAAYVLSRYPATTGATPSTWHYALSKLTLPLAAAAADPLVAGSPTYTAIGREASHLMLLEPRNKLTRTANLYYGLGNGRLYQSEP